MRIVLIGPLGSGKANLAEKMGQIYQVPIITQTSVLDTAAKEPTELGKLAKEARDTSRVSDDLLLALLRLQLPNMDLTQGYVLVDIPRSEVQAVALEELLTDFNAPFDRVINLDVDTDDLMERLVGYIACDHCGADYNLYVNPPMVDGVCDVCGARVIKRPPDYEETISNRLRLYDIQMIPVLERYKSAAILQRFTTKLDDPDSLLDEVKNYLDNESFPKHSLDQAESNTAEIDTKGATQALEAAIEAMSPGRKKVSRKKAAAKKTTKKKAVAKKGVSKKVAKKRVTKKA